MGCEGGVAWVRIRGRFSLEVMGNAARLDTLLEPWMPWLTQKGPSSYQHLNSLFVESRWETMQDCLSGAYGSGCGDSPTLYDFPNWLDYVDGVLVNMGLDMGSTWDDFLLEMDTRPMWDVVPEARISDAKLKEWVELLRESSSSFRIQCVGEWLREVRGLIVECDYHETWT